MMERLSLAMAAKTHGMLKTHLFPGDGNESAAVLICKAALRNGRRLLVRETILVPHEACRVRAPDRIVWPGAYIEEAIARAEAEGLTILLIHSHPGGWLEFSRADDESDTRTMPALFAAFGNRHGSAIMAPNGAIRARLYRPDMSFDAIELVTVSGHDISYWWNEDIHNGVLVQWPLPFTEGMRRQLGRLSFAVIGVSGTGSVVAEQLARLGIGKLTLID
ncbi:MAG: thiamine biosynthesis protein ThiF, partial [Alishewanella sp. 32-51-5]